MQYGSLTSRDDPCDEVEPLRFQELCRALPTLQYTVQVRAHTGSRAILYEMNLFGARWTSAQLHMTVSRPCHRIRCSVDPLPSPFSPTPPVHADGHDRGA